MKKLIDKILSQKIFQEKPPVLIDIGASGEIHAAWNSIAKYSICIAFDADDRDFEVTETKDSGYRKLFKINRVVTAQPAEELDFYLTRSPHCSSGLEPDIKALEPWAFRDLFALNKKIKLPAITLTQALSQCGINYIDWYKTDSQGTDLRIFKSLPLEVSEQMIAAEFEPGILDAYKHEDKLHSLMSHMDKLPFWVTDMHLKGSQRIDQKYLAGMSSFKKRFLRFFLRTPPGWCEIAYLNEFRNNTSQRDLLLGWVISTLKNEYGFALHLANRGMLTSNNDLFEVLSESSRASIGGLAGYYKLSNFAFNRLVKKIFK